MDTKRYIDTVFLRNWLLVLILGKLPCESFSLDYKFDDFVDTVEQNGASIASKHNHLTN